MKNRSGNQLLQLLHDMELQLTQAAVEELIRLLCSSHFHRVTPRQVRSVGEYKTIEIEGERYFERAFSPGKEASSSLALARMIGRDDILEDLIDLRDSLVEPAKKLSTSLSTAMPPESPPH
jgi:hypothetical protein